MRDPSPIREHISAVEDAFGHAHGTPTFESQIDSSRGADDGAVQIQKACRLLDFVHNVETIGEYYGVVLEHSFIVIEHTFQGYLLVVTGTEAYELRDHDSPYEFAKGQVPLEDETIETLRTLYDERRTGHYYGTTVTTKTQAHRMRDLATAVHEHVVDFDPETARHCRCG